MLIIRDETPFPEQVAVLFHAPIEDLCIEVRDVDERTPLDEVVLDVPYKPLDCSLGVWMGHLAQFRAETQAASETHRNHG